MRKCSEGMQNGLKTAFKRVLDDLGGIEAAASCTRVGKSQLSDYGNIACDKMVPVDVVLDLELVSGQPHVTAALAATQGFELLPVDKRPTHELLASLARIADDNGRLFGDVARMIGGMPTEHHRSLLRRHLTNVVAAAREALAAVPEEDE
jgi:hypothetical protein